MPKILELSGKRFCRLIALYRTKNKQHGHYKWRCICDCGNEIEVAGSSLCSGNTKSCGCLRVESATERMIQMSTTHGLRRHPLYKVWDNMIQRCGNENDKDFKNYGYRGITVCNKWKNDFKIFYDWATANGWKTGLQIDRIKNNRSYEPSNCRFTTHQINNCNRRDKSKYGSGVTKVKNRFLARITIDGIRMRIGTFNTAEEAADAYKRKLKEICAYS